MSKIAKDCLLTLVKSRLALGSPGCSVVRSSPCRKWLNTQTNSCWLRPVQPSTPQFSLLQPTTAQFSLVKTSTVQYSPVQPSTAQYSTAQSTTAHHHQCRWKYTTMYTSLHCTDSLLHRSTLVLSLLTFFEQETSSGPMCYGTSVSNYMLRCDTIF